MTYHIKSKFAIIIISFYQLFRRYSHDLFFRFFKSRVGTLVVDIMIMQNPREHTEYHFRG